MTIPEGSSRKQDQSVTRRVVTAAEGRPQDAGPLPILETDYVNIPLPNQVGDWAKAVVGGNVWMELGGTPYGWTNMHNPHEQYDAPLTAVSGTVVEQPKVSDEDMPFLHPFHYDFEFHLAPDEQYFDLVAPGGDDSYVASAKRAHDEFGLDVPGVLGMEIEEGLVPPVYRPEFGDRVCLFGRWIVNAGHSDFHAEIHPPLIMVSAQEALSTQQAGLAPAKGDATKVRIITRPYLVSQEFGDGALFEHLLKEIAKVEGHVSLELEAHPRLMPKPFVGENIVTFTVRPPTPRENPSDALVLSFQFVRRSSRGIAIQVVPAPDRNSVKVVMVLNEAGYNPAPEPHRVNRHVKQAEIG